MADVGKLQVLPINRDLLMYLLHIGVFNPLSQLSNLSENFLSMTKFKIETQTG